MILVTLGRTITGEDDLGLGLTFFSKKKRKKAELFGKC